MRISVAQSLPERHAQAGFTLVELMVVLAVMGLLAGVAVWRWPAGGDNARADAFALATRIAAARDTAIVGGRPVAFVLEPSGYRFEVRDRAGWTPSTEPNLRTKRWSRGVSLFAPAGTSRIRFDAIGLPDRPSTMRLRSGATTTDIRILADGEVKVS